VSPGGHLITTAVACALTQSITGAWPLTAGVAAGGFLIDVDHVVDYVVFERAGRLTPGAFLRHYVEGRTRRVVLVLHSYEIVALLGLMAWWTQADVLLGYLAGALMHLALDLVFNGRLTPRSITAFYSFAYRASHRFDARRLLAHPRLAPAGAFWTAFFRGSALAPEATPHAGPIAPAPSPPVSRSLANFSS
jgi:hypothetical protein